MSNKLNEKTLYSLSTEPPTAPDRRSEDRYVSLLRVGAMTIEGRRELCLIRNVSAGGMMIRPYSQLEPGTHVTIELKHGVSASGAAQWADNGLIGVAFDEPVDVLSLLTDPGGETRARMPRLEVNCTASLRYQDFTFRAEIANISQGGICIHSPVDLDLNSDVVITIAGLGPNAGIVKWQEGEHFGIGFNRVYSVEELMGFLKRQQQSEQQRSATGSKVGSSMVAPC